MKKEETRNPLIGRMVTIYRMKDCGGDNYTVTIRDIRDGLIFSNARSEGRPLVIGIASVKSIRINDGECEPRYVNVGFDDSTKAGKKKIW